MIFRVLGTAAGGGLPQWNCGCPTCTAARQGKIQPRLQASAAFSPEGKRWYIINATPDITTQLARTPALHPKSVRETPIKGVLLTDAELDHVLGLIHLREGANWDLYATASVAECLSKDFPALDVLNQYVAHTQVSTIALGQDLHFGEGDSAVRVRAVQTGDELPRYAGHKRADGAVIGLIFTTQQGKKLVYAPGVSFLDDTLAEAFTGADVILCDGTLYTNEELQTLGVGTATAADMGHVPMTGRTGKGSAAWLAKLGAGTTRYVHINNTNPALLPHSAEHQALLALGVDIAEEPWEVTL